MHTAEVIFLFAFSTCDIKGNSFSFVTADDSNILVLFLYDNGTVMFNGWDEPSFLTSILPLLEPQP